MGIGFRDVMHHPQLRRTALIRIALWTLALGFFLILGLSGSLQESKQVALARAQNNFKKDLALSAWATERGGVYVPLDSKTSPNPYLKDIEEREIISTSGKHYTLVNPAYLTRMTHEQGLADFGMQSHITSLTPIRPENVADAWETKVLKRFEGGVREYWEVVKVGGHPYLRFMGALVTEEACLHCHRQQGYKVGDIRGGISVTVPMETTGSLLGGIHNLTITLGVAAIWLLGVGTILTLGKLALRAKLDEQRHGTALASANQRVANLLEAAQVGTWQWNVVTGETTFNVVYARMLGYEKEELEPLTVNAWTALCHPDDLARVTEKAAQCYRGEHPDYDCELRLRHKAGHWVWLWDRGSLIARTQHGDPLLMAGIGTDITARKEGEAKIAASEARLAWVLKTSGGGVWDWDIENNLVTHNAQWCHLLGLDESLLAHPVEIFQELIHPEDAPEVMTRIQAALEPGGVYYSEHRMRHADGHWLWVEDRAEVMQRDPAGKALRLVGSFTDNTSRKLAEQTLVSLNERLEQRVTEEVSRNQEQARFMEQKARSSDMGEMVSAIAHQWRQPLNALSVILANVKDAARFGDLTSAYLVDKIGKGDLLIQKMSTTINDFMVYFWGDKPVEVFAVRQAVLEAIGLVEATFQHHHIQLTLDGNEDALVKGYPGEFSQVLMNILFNARDAISGCQTPNGAVWINILPTDQHCQLTINDNGGGIQVQPIERVFAPYTSSKPQGSGLGLFLAKRIVEHGLEGKLTVRNTEYGAEFLMLLPIAEVTHDHQQS